MAASAKNADFITRSRQAAAGVLSALAVLDEIRQEWDSNFSSAVTADDFTGTNAEINLTILTGEMTTQGNLKTVMDAGNRTNLLKVK